MAASRNTYVTLCRGGAEKAVILQTSKHRGRRRYQSIAAQARVEARPLYAQRQ